MEFTWISICTSFVSIHERMLPEVIWRRKTQRPAVATATLGHRAIRANGRRDHRVGRNSGGARVCRGRRRYGASCRPRRANDRPDLAARHRKSCGERHPIDDDGGAVGGTHGTKRAASTTATAASRTAGRAMRAAKRRTGTSTRTAKRTEEKAKRPPTDRAESVGAEGAAEYVPIEIDAVQEKGAKSGRSRKRS